MSLGYAEKLSFIEDVGNVGMTEVFDPPHVLQEKIEQLAMMIKKSKHLVVFTGAGISTSCGIPDFRGPKGIWTLKREGKALPKASLPFHRAMPSMTHMALVELEKAGILKYVISQNIDGLHLRSGIPREKLAELHGDSFMETCPSCGAEYLRDFEMETIGLKETARHCSDAKCGAKLKDTVLDWEDALPPKEMNPAERHCRKADIVLCLGTSLQITPACNLPLKSLSGGGNIVIVNLQKTPKDKKASLVIHGLVDKVIAGVMSVLNLPVPPFVRIDVFQIILTQALSMDKRYVNWTIFIAGVHGQNAPLPFIESVEVSFLDVQSYKPAVLRKYPFKLKRCLAMYEQNLNGLNALLIKVFQPEEMGLVEWNVSSLSNTPLVSVGTWRTERTKTFEIVLKLNFSEGCGCLSTQVNIPVDFKAATESFKHDRDAIFQKLRDTAIQDLCSGQKAIIEKNATSAPKTEAMVYAIVTNIAVYNKASNKADSVSNGDVKSKNENTNGTETSYRKQPNRRKRKSR